MAFAYEHVTDLTGHQGPIHAITFSAGLGQYILTGSADRSIRLYNPAKSTSSTLSSGLIQSYNAHGYEILDLAVAGDNARFASVGGDKQVFLWDVSSARTLRRWAGHFGRVNAVAFGGDEASVVVSGSFDATVRLWDAKSQSTKPIQVLEEAGDSVTSVVANGWEIVSGSVDGRVRTYDLRMGMLSSDLVGREASQAEYHHGSVWADFIVADSITSLQMTKDGNAILVSTLDSTIRLFDKGNGQLLKSYSGHTNRDYRIRSCLGAADSVVLSGSEDGSLYIWDVLTGDVLLTVKAHDGKVASAVAWNDSRKEWATGGTNSIASVWKSRK